MVYESDTKERRIPSCPAHAVHGPTTDRGPQSKLAYVGEIKKVDPTPNAAFVVGFRSTGVLFAGPTFRRRWWGSRSLEPTGSLLSLSVPASHGVSRRKAWDRS